MGLGDVLRILGKAMPENDEERSFLNKEISRRGLLAGGLAGLTYLFLPTQARDASFLPSEQEEMICRANNEICPKLFGQHWGIWKYDELFQKRGEGYSWERAHREIDNIAEYANTIAIHSSMNIDPETGHIYEMRGNSRRLEALDRLYSETRQRHPHLNIIDKLHLEPPDKTPRTWIIPSPEAAKNFFEYTYHKAMVTQAELAQRRGLEYLSIACELDGFVKYTEEWAYLTQEIRGIYHGEIIYSGIPLKNTVKCSPAGCERGYFIPEIDDVEELAKIVDRVGIDFYKPLGWRESKDVYTMIRHMRPFINLIEELHGKIGARFLITETGHDGSVGGHIDPWTKSDIIDREEQKNYILAVFKATFEHPLFDGVILYNTTCDYDITGTPAEEAIKEAYSLVAGKRRVDG